MNPTTGQIITEADLSTLRITDPSEAAKFSVRLNGTPEDVQKVADAVQAQYRSRTRAANRRRNKAARKARRAGR